MKCKIFKIMGLSAKGAFSEDEKEIDDWLGSMKGEIKIVQTAPSRQDLVPAAFHLIIFYEESNKLPPGRHHCRAQGTHLLILAPRCDSSLRGVPLISRIVLFVQFSILTEATYISEPT